MRYFTTTLTINLRAQLRGKRFWLILILTLTAGLFLRWTFQPSTNNGAVQVGVVLPADGAPFLDVLTRRGDTLVEFIPADEQTARSKVSTSHWDCALILPEDFTGRLSATDLTGSITLLTGPGSTVYPLVRETAAAAILELTSSRIAADYLHSAGIAIEAVPQTMPQPQGVKIEMETLTGQPLNELKLAEESFSRIFRGIIAVALLVWTLFAAVDLGRWQETGAARRMRPIQGPVLLILPRLLSSMLPAFLCGVLALLTTGASTGPVGILSLALYLADLTALALLLSTIRPVWTVLPAIIPFAAASVFILSPTFVDITLFIPQLAPLSHWLPATLYLQGGEGGLSSIFRLLLLTAILTAAALLLEHFPQNRQK